MSYSKKKLIKKFDPNGVGEKGRLFGLPFDRESSEIVVIPVPWDVTASFNDGASMGPKAVLNVSSQIDLFMPKIKDAWRLGISMLPIDDDWIAKNEQARTFAAEYIRRLEFGSSNLAEKDIKLILQNINLLSEKINTWVYERSREILNEDKIPVVLGGDHSSPYGLMKAIAEKYPEFGVLQIDAHADLRPEYEGFKYSHASIMHNLLQLNNVSALVQVGVRDLCEQEYQTIQNDERIIPFFGDDIASKKIEGITWSKQVEEILHRLPDVIYISFDVDGMEQNFCPNTGTPVPGGLSYDEVLYLFEAIMRSDKTIVSFDLCEIWGKKDGWDAIVGSRLLYNLANITAVTHKLLHLTD